MIQLQEIETETEWIYLREEWMFCFMATLYKCVMRAGNVQLANKWQNKIWSRLQGYPQRTSLTEQCFIAAAVFTVWKSAKKIPNHQTINSQSSQITKLAPNKIVWFHSFIIDDNNNNPIYHRGSSHPHLDCHVSSSKFFQTVHSGGHQV